MTVLIDTNVILDHILMRELAEDARACLDWLIINKAKAWLTASTITDIYYVTRRATRDGEKAKGVIAKLLNAFQISNVDKADCVSALDVDFDDYEDALVFICAKKIKAEYIITQNKDDFANSTIPALTPAEFLKQHQK